MPDKLVMKTTKYSPKEYSDRLTRTFLGVPPSKGGLGVPELRTGLNSLLRSCKTLKNKSRADSINCGKTARNLKAMKSSTMKKQELLDQLKPYRRDVNRIKVEVGISPGDEMEKKVLRLEKDPKLKYKARHYKAKKYTAEQRTVSYWGRKKYVNHYYNTDTTELKKAIRRIQSRRNAHGVPPLSSELLNIASH